MTRSRSFLVASIVGSIVGSLIAVAALVGSGAPIGAQESTTSNGVTRIELAEGTPANAPGQELYLQEVRLAPGAKLPTHFHQGTQVASVRKGVLTYDIVSGSAQVTRADGTVETFDGPASMKLRKGDALLEPETDVHFGSNDTKKPVVILVAALLAQGAPLATPIESPGG
jgi:quercetin dioxygenase-like cupin family protein